MFHPSFFQLTIPSLEKALQSKQLEKVEQLLAQGTDPNAYLNSEFHTPLMIAAKEDLADIVQCLIKYGANPETKDSNHHTPLHFALNHYYPRNPFDLFIDPTREANHLRVIRLLTINSPNCNLELCYDSEESQNRSKQIFRSSLYNKRTGDIFNALNDPTLRLEDDFSKKEKLLRTGKIWALLREDFFPILQGLSQSHLFFEQLPQKRLKKLPKELWIQIFTHFLTKKLKEKVVWLHILPHAERNLENVRIALHQLLPLYETGELKQIYIEELRASDSLLPDFQRMIEECAEGDERVTCTYAEASAYNRTWELHHYDSDSDSSYSNGAYFY